MKIILIFSELSVLETLVAKLPTTTNVLRCTIHFRIRISKRKLKYEAQDWYISALRDLFMKMKHLNKNCGFEFLLHKILPKKIRGHLNNKVSFT